MALMETRNTLIPIAPVVTNGICFMCQSISKEDRFVTSVKSHSDISKNLQRYLNVQVSEGFLCKSCHTKLESVIAKVDGLRDGLLVDQAESYSKSHLNKWLNAVYEASEKDECVLTWNGPAQDIHANLYDLQKQQVFCDVNLVDVKGGLVMAHACVLAAGSPVLKSTLMLKQTYSWLKKDGINLQVAGISRREWKTILEYLYLGKINIVLNSQLIKRVHRAAKMLKILSLATLIWRKVGSLRLKVDLSGEVGKVKMNLSACGEMQEQGTTETERNLSADGITLHGKSDGEVDVSVSGDSTKDTIQSDLNVDEKDEENVERNVQGNNVEERNQTFDGLDSRMSVSERADLGMQMVKLENIWQADGEAMDDETLQEQLRMLKREQHWDGRTYATSEIDSTAEEPKRRDQDLFWYCKFCAEELEAKMDLVEHIVSSCPNLNRIDEITEKVFDEVDEITEKVFNEVDDVCSDSEDVVSFPAAVVKIPKKRGRKRRNFSPTAMENISKAKPTYVCFNDECCSKFLSHSFYMGHLRQCVMREGPVNPQSHVKTIGNTLVYDDGLEILGDSVDEKVHRPYATLCSKLLKVSNKQIYQCAQCCVKGDQQRMIVHLANVHIKAKTFCCKKCPAKYGYFGSFKDHYVSSHTNQTYKCSQDTCKRVFTKKDSLNRHILMEHKRQGKQLYLCKGCGKTFKLAHHARRHEMYHRKEDRKFVCNTCYKAFATKQDLQRHTFIHTGAKPYKCSQCTYSAARKFNLILHERKHGVMHGQYSCHTCGKHFITEVNMKNHLKRHENPPRTPFYTKPVSSESSVTQTIKIEEEVKQEEQAEVSAENPGIGNIKVKELEAIQTVQTVQEAMTEQASGNLVYILTAGQPYDYALVDTSMLNT